MTLIFAKNLENSYLEFPSQYFKKKCLVVLNMYILWVGIFFKKQEIARGHLD